MADIPSTPAAPTVYQDVEFARGCWSQRDTQGMIVQILRLQPLDGPNSPTLEGAVERFSRSAGMLRSVHYSFSRDGRTLAIDGDSERLAASLGDASRRPYGGETYLFLAPPTDTPRILSATSRRATFAGPRKDWHIIEAEGDRLAIFSLWARGEAISVFDGRRDICD